MTIPEVTQKAEELAAKYNPRGLAPFPFENITAVYRNLDLIYSDDLDDDIAGAVLYKTNEFTILVNAAKPFVHQHFTIAHEFGHFFLHQTAIKSQQALVDGERNVDGQKPLFRRDDVANDLLEVEANNFGASLIMPERLVRDVWEVSEGIEDAAKLFHVSVVAMSIRLQRLGLVE